ncbi:P-loop containing nucleoside triphosphate hydrolase protein [Auriculariales sp. MPI-PUGE-AT-0066]|nr:P-loop containing nucleoside triphosphate hydrolase protein [Auriculariales sp. MPI-PUGE-AT-0066]
MQPFVLQRRNDQVLKDLPKKTERIEWCEMTETQSTHYKEVLNCFRKILLEQQAVAEKTAAASTDQLPANLDMPTAESRAKETERKLHGGGVDLSSSVLMDLRKAAAHPALFRVIFDEDMLRDMAKAIMTDSELQHFCKTYDCVERFVQNDDMYLNSGKIKALLRLLDGFFEEKRRVLIFSQFLQVLEILKVVLNIRGIKYLVLTGQTAVDTRLGLVDEFNQDESISVFLLSTTAGGMGINLTAASVVILHDQDFNPHNDKQAADRAYQIGQKRDCRGDQAYFEGTIEVSIRICLCLLAFYVKNTCRRKYCGWGETKLALDEAVVGEALGPVAGATTRNGDEECKNARKFEIMAEKQIKVSLVDSIKRQLVLEDEQKPDLLDIKVDSDGPLSTLSVPLKDEDDYKPELDE